MSHAWHMHRKSQNARKAFSQSGAVGSAMPARPECGHSTPTPTTVHPPAPGSPSGEHPGDRGTLLTPVWPGGAHAGPFTAARRPGAHHPPPGGLSAAVTLPTKPGGARQGGVRRGASNSWRQQPHGEGAPAQGTPTGERARRPACGGGLRGRPRQAALSKERENPPPRPRGPGVAAGGRMGRGGAGPLQPACTGGGTSTAEPACTGPRGRATPGERRHVPAKGGTRPSRHAPAPRAPRPPTAVRTNTEAAPHSPVTACQAREPH